MFKNIFYKKPTELETKFQTLADDYNKLQESYSYLQEYSTAQNEEIVRISSEFCSLNLALKDFYDDEFINCLYNKADKIDGRAYIEESYKQAHPQQIQINISFFRP